MMKKVWLIISAVVLVFGLAVLGCSSGGGGGETPGGGDEVPDGNYDDLWDDQWVEGTSKGGPTSLKLTDNFQYGSGYQNTINWTSLLNADIKKYDIYQLEIDFTVSRNLEADLQWVIVDTDPNAQPRAYWSILGRYKTVVDGQDEEEPTATQAPDDPDGPITPKGEGFTTTDNVSYVGRILITQAGPKASSVLAFTTKGKGTKGTAGSGEKGEVTLTFSKFKITKLAWGEAPDPGEEPDEGNLGLPAYNRGGSASNNWNNEEVGGESQAIWMVEGGSYDLIIAPGTKLVVEFENEIAGGMQIIWQDKTDWGWNQNDILTNNGGSDSTKGTSVSEDKKTITIDLSLALKDYDKPTTGFLDKTAAAQGVKLILAYYTGANKMHGLKVVKADLVPGVVVPTVTSVTLAPATASVEKGGTKDFTATVTGTHNPATTVTWTVEGAGKAAGTTIDSTGKLTIAADEPLTSLTVRATSTVDSTKSGTATVTVTNLPPTVTSVTITPASASVLQGKTQQFTATVVGENDPLTTVTWSIETSGKHAKTIIDENGLLTVALNETKTSITVRAKSNQDNTKYKDATVTVTAATRPSGFFELGAFDFEGKTWAVNGTNECVNSLTENIFHNAKYLILDVVSIANQNGFGGLQVVVQGNGNSWAWHEFMVTKGWTKPENDTDGWELNYGSTDTFFIIVDLTSMDDWDDVAIAGGQAKLTLNVIPSQVTITKAYLTSEDLVMPATNSIVSSGAGGKSWAARTVPEMTP